MWKGLALQPTVAAPLGSLDRGARQISAIQTLASVVAHVILFQRGFPILCANVQLDTLVHSVKLNYCLVNQASARMEELVKRGLEAPWFADVLWDSRETTVKSSTLALQIPVFKAHVHEMDLWQYARVMPDLLGPRVTHQLEILAVWTLIVPTAASARYSAPQTAIPRTPLSLTSKFQLISVGLHSYGHCLISIQTSLAMFLFLLLLVSRQDLVVTCTSRAHWERSAILLSF